MFCGECGTKVEAEAPVAEVALAPEAVEPATEPVEQPTEAPITAYAEEQGFTIVEPTEADEAPCELDEAPVKKRKKGKFLKIFIPSVAVLLVAAIVLGLTLFKGLVIKTFGSDEQYFQYVQDKALTSFNENYIDNYYAKFLENLKKDSTVTTSLNLTVDDDLAELVSIDGSLSWVNDLKLVLNQKTTADKSQINAMLNISGKDIISVDAIMNGKDNSLYLALPELSKKYLGVNMSDIMPTSTQLQSISNADLAKALPSPETVKKLTDRYYKLALSHIEDVQKTSEKVTVEDITQKCTVITFEIDEDIAEEIAKAVIKELKKDDDVKEIIKDFEKVLKDAGVYNSDESLYSSFKDALEEFEDEAGEISSEDGTLEISQYIDSSHNVIGTVIDADGDEVLNSITIRKGTKVATEIIIGEELEIVGNGEVKKNIFEGEYEISFDGDTYCKLYVSDFDIKRYEKGELKGTYKFEPTDELMDVIPEEIGDVLSVLDPQLEFVFDDTETTSKTEINILNGKKTLIGISIDSKIKESAKISVPSDSVDVTDEDAVNEWISTLDGEKVIAALEKTKLPDTFIEQVTYILENINTLTLDDLFGSEDADVVGGYYDDDYDYDYDYDYDFDYDYEYSEDDLVYYDYY